jgi:hypothetical protein
MLRNWRQSVQELDPRVVKVTIEVNGKLKTYDNLAIVATGTKYANSIQNECEIKIVNLDKPTRDYILTETSPFNANRTPKKFMLEAGRKSYGVSKIFAGNISSSSISQPPDIEVVLKCLTGNYLKGDIVSRSQPATTKLSGISRQVSNDLGMTLNFQAQDKNIGNYSFSGGSLKQVNKLGEAGGVDAYIDDDILVVKDKNKPLKNKIKILSAKTGMIGIPEITEEGIKVKYLLDNITQLGSAIRINSQIYPAINGDYVIYKLGFEIASRDVPFYWIAEAKRA